MQSIQVQYFVNMAYLWSIENFRILKRKFSPLWPNIFFVLMSFASFHLVPMYWHCLQENTTVYHPRHYCGLEKVCWYDGALFWQLPPALPLLCWNAAGELGSRHVSNVWQLQHNMLSPHLDACLSAAFCEENRLISVGDCLFKHLLRKNKAKSFRQIERSR